MLKKNILVVYLEETTLAKGLNLQLNSQQSLFRQRHSNDESFLRELVKAPILSSCKEGAESDLSFLSGVKLPEKKANGVALIKTAKGAVIRILICFGAYVHFDHNYRLMGTRGNIHTDLKVEVYNAHSFATLHSVPDSYGNPIEIPVTTGTNGGHGGADGKMFADFISCVTEGRKPILDVDFAITMSLPGVLAHESAIQGGMPMEIPKI